MNYRTVYDNTKVLTTIVNDETTVTTSNEKFIIDTITNSIDRLASWGIDVSFFWKQGHAVRYTPINEISISNHPDDASVSRKAFVASLAIDYPNKKFRFNTIVMHFDSGGNHITDLQGDGYDDEFVSRIVDNSVQVDDGQGGQIGEYDFFYQVISSGIYTLFQLQQARIPVMDSNNLFDDIY